MPVPVWHNKRGDDFAAPEVITVKVDGTAVDLSGPDWQVACQARSSESDSDYVTFDIDDALLSEGKVWLKLPRAVTEGMSGVYVIDLQVTNDAISLKRRSSATWTLTVELDVTRVEAEAEEGS